MTNKVSLNVPEDQMNSNDKQQFDVIIQGKRTTIKRGSDVEVKPIVKEMYNLNLHKTQKANKRNPKLVVMEEK